MQRGRIHVGARRLHQDKVAVARGKGHTHFGECICNTLALRNGLVNALLNGRRVLEALERGNLRELVGVERLAHGLQGLHPRFRPDSVPDTQAAEAVGLAEGAGDKQVGPGAREHRHAAAVGFGDEVVVGLVNQHGQVVGHQVEKALDVVGRPVHARGVVRVADDDQARALVHSGGHGVEVVPPVGCQRDGHGVGACGGGQVRVHGE